MSDDPQPTPAEHDPEPEGVIEIAKPEGKEKVVPLAALAYASRPAE